MQCMCAWARTGTASSAQSTYTPCPTRARSANTARPQSACPVTSPSRFTRATLRHSALPTTWCIPTCRPRRIPRLRRDTGHFRGRKRGFRAGRPAGDRSGRHPREEYGCASARSCRRITTSPQTPARSTAAWRAARRSSAGTKIPPCATWGTARCAPRAWPWPCRARASRAWTSARPPSS